MPCISVPRTQKFSTRLLLHVCGLDAKDSEEAESAEDAEEARFLLDCKCLFNVSFDGEARFLLDFYYMYVCRCLLEAIFRLDFYYMYVRKFLLEAIFLLDFYCISPEPESPINPRIPEFPNSRIQHCPKGKQGQNRIHRHHRRTVTKALTCLIEFY